MSRRPPPPPPHCGAPESALDTLHAGPPELGDYDTVAVPLASADTLPCPRLGGAGPPELGDCVTVAVPLANADTLPCPRLEGAELPTLRASPAELAALVKLTLPGARCATPSPIPRPGPRLSAPPSVQPQAVRRPDPGPNQPMPRAPRAAPAGFAATRPRRLAPELARPQPHRSTRTASACETPARHKVGGELIPTQLWFAPVAPAPSAPPRSWWSRLCALLGFAGSPSAGNPVRYPGYHRQPSRRR